MDKKEALRRIKEGSITVEDLADPETLKAVEEALQEIYPDLDLSGDIAEQLLNDPEVQDFIDKLSSE